MGNTTAKTNLRGGWTRILIAASIVWALAAHAFAAKEAWDYLNAQESVSKWTAPDSCTEPNGGFLKFGCANPYETSMSNHSSNIRVALLTCYGGIALIWIAFYAVLWIGRGFRE